MADVRSANPDQLEILADKLCAPGDGGAYGDLAAIFDRARALGASGEVTSLAPVLTWLTDTASQLRDKAALLRGDTPLPNWGGSAPTPADLEAYEERANADPDAPFRVLGQANIDRFLELAQRQELSEEDLEEMRSWLGAFSSDPNFAAALVDQMGVADFLALARRVESQADGLDDPTVARDLRNQLALVLTAAFYLPGGMRPGTDEYDEWVENTPQGQAFAARLEAFQNSGEANLADAAQLVSGLINADDLSAPELFTLNEFLASNYQNGDFNRALMDAISPEGLISLAERLPGLANGGDEKLRPGYADLQTNIANAVASATDVGRPQPGAPWYEHWAVTSEAQWYVDFMSRLHEAGMENYFDTDITDDPGGVRGYQYLVTLLQSGSGYSTGFLTHLADNIRSAEDPSRGGNKLIWRETLISYGRGHEPREAPEWFAQDPLDGVLGIMSRHPDAAATYLDPDNGDALAYLINDRNWELDHVMRISGEDVRTTTEETAGARTGFAAALEAATTGRPAGSSDDTPFQRTPQGDRVMREIVDRFSRDEGALIADDGDFAFMRPQLGIMASAFMEEFNYTLGDTANLLHAHEAALPDLFETDNGALPVDYFLGQLARDPDAYGALTGAQQAFTALAVEVAMNEHTNSGVNIGDRVEHAIAPGARIAGILADARAAAVFEEGIADDEAFNEKLEIAETAAGLVIGEGVGLLTERLPVGGDIVSWGVEELQSSIFDALKRDTSDEAYADADDEYRAAREAAGDAARHAIDVAGNDYVPANPDEDVDATLTDLKNGVGDIIDSNWEVHYHWTRPPQEGQGE